MKMFQGKVVADKMKKTVVVLIERKFRHPLYGKILKRKGKIHARNEIGAKIGQLVEIKEGKPMAKTVSFTVVKIIEDKK